MQKLHLLHEQAVNYSKAAYNVIYMGDKEPSDPLVKALGQIEDPDDMSAWLHGGKLKEEIGERHNCGFYIYINLAASVDPNAIASLYFDTAFEHSGPYFTRPDKSIIQTSFDAGHLAFVTVGSRRVFKLTDLGRARYLRWLHDLMPRRFPEIPSVLG